ECQPGRLRSLRRDRHHPARLARLHTVDSHAPRSAARLTFSPRPTVRRLPPVAPAISATTPPLPLILRWSPPVLPATCAGTLSCPTCWSTAPTESEAHVTTARL